MFKDFVTLECFAKDLRNRLANMLFVLSLGGFSAGRLFTSAVSQRRSSLGRAHLTG